MTIEKDMIKFEGVTRVFHMGDNTFQALRGLDFSVDEGDMLAIVGPSGSGKTTTMNILGLLDHPTDGRYLLHGKDIVAHDSDELAALRNREIGFVFQSFFLLPRLTALQNVSLPLLYRDTPRREMKERSMAALEKVAMADHWHHKPSELSGGQQQRVAIARALVGEPSLILADEPTGALDSKTSDEVMTLLTDLNEKDNATVVMITHDVDIANRFRSQIHIHDGLIVKPKEAVI